MVEQVAGPTPAVAPVGERRRWLVPWSLAGRFSIGGLDFPGEPDPDYWDFVYFSLAIGMTFGTTNVRATTGRFRRVMLPHKLLSFAFNTAILALVLGILFR